MRITLGMQKNFLLISFTPKYQIKRVNPGNLDASKPTRNGSFISLGRRKSPLKERKHGSLARGKGAKSNYFRRNQMAKVTYRGVEYDSKEYNAKVLAEAAKRQRHDLMYRGLKVAKSV